MAIPDRIRVEGSLKATRPAALNTANVTVMAPTNAAEPITPSPAPPETGAKTMAIAAPRAAPELIPSRYGSDRGFRNNP